MAPHPPPPKQLDIPLKWERGPEPSAAPAAGEPTAKESLTRRTPGLLRFWAGILADVGIVLLGVGACWAIAALAGVRLWAPQLLLAAVAGVEIAGVLAVGCLWGWRASPGMLLLDLAFLRPIRFGLALRMWLAWLASFPLVGLPLLLRRRGANLAERIAGSRLSFRSTPGSA
jgi:hypothetical protein